MSGTIPVGTVLMWAGSADPAHVDLLYRAGWLLCDGAGYLMREYPELALVIGQTYGGEEDRFCVPSYKGYFVRGVSGDSGRDPDADERRAPRPDQAIPGAPGNRVGSIQDDDYVSHTHGYHHFPGRFRTAAFQEHIATAEGRAPTKPVGAAETRPVNQYVTFIVKFTSAVEDVPPGVVIPYAAPIAQARRLRAAGWLPCDGAQLSQDDYPGLFRSIARFYGGEEHTFCLPDYRGRFLRGTQSNPLPGQHPVDPDAAKRTAPRPELTEKGHEGNFVGSVQASSFAEHHHVVELPAEHTLTGDTHDPQGLATQLHGQKTDEGQPATIGGHMAGESRPQNINANFLIRVS